MVGVVLLFHLLCLSSLLCQVRLVLLYHSSRPPVEVSLTLLVSCDLARVFCANFVLVVVYSFCLSMEIRWEGFTKANQKNRRKKEKQWQL